MLKRNNLPAGIIAGAIVPLTIWVLFTFPLQGFVLLNKPLLPYFVAIVLNLIFMRVAYRKQADRFAAGIMISTFTFTILVVLFKLTPAI